MRLRKFSPTIPCALCQFCGPMVSPGLRSSSAAWDIKTTDKSATEQAKTQQIAEKHFVMGSPFTDKFIIGVRVPFLELVAHFQKDRIFFVKKAERLELVATAVESADQAEFKLLISRGYIADGGIGRPVAFRIVADKYVRKYSIAGISGADSEGERGRDSPDLFCGGKRVNPVLMIEDDALENLERKTKRSPGIVGVKKGNQSRAIEAQRVSEGILFHHCAGVARIHGGSQTECAWKFCDVIRLIGQKHHFSPDRGVDRDIQNIAYRIVKMAGKYVCTIVDQPQIDHAWSKTCQTWTRDWC